MKLILFCCLFNFVFGYYEISDEQYYQMPKLFDLDDYTECMSQTNGTYCLGIFDLMPTRYSEIYERMKEYSKDSYNYNHTRLHRGLCMSKRCTHLNDSEVEVRFSKCIDLYTRERYGFSSRVHKINYCRTRDFENETSENENWFGFVCKCIVFLNVFGTVYDVVSGEGKKNPYIICWSLKSNWKLLTGDNVCVEFNHLKPLQFGRVLGSWFVMLGHIFLTLIRTYMHNPRDLEVVSQAPSSMLVHNGTAIVQLFTVIANLFLTYKILHAADMSSGKFGLNMLPSLLVKRLIRILPSYYLALAFAATWWPKMSSGPTWPVLVEEESRECRENWLSRVLLVFNLLHITGGCLPQTWSMVSDLQLYVVSSSLALLLARRKHALSILIGLFVASIIHIFGVSYMFNFKAMMMVGDIETIRSVYKDENSVARLYISPWASAPSCLLGMLLAQIIYKIQKKNSAQHKKDDKIVPINEKQQFGIKFLIFRSLFFIILAWILTGYYMKDHASPLVISLYTALERPVFALLVGGIIYGGWARIDHFWLNLGSWNGWRVPGRLNLWVLLAHWIVTVSYYASSTQLISFTTGTVIVDLIAVIFSTYAVALPLTLMVEMPAQRFLLKLIFT